METDLTTDDATTLLVVFDPFNELRGRYQERFVLLELVSDKENVWIVTQDQNRLDHLPQAVLALVVPAESSHRAISVPIERAFCARFGPEVPIFHDYPGLEVALERLLKDRTRSARLTSALMSQLAQLRKIHEELQNGHRALRDALSNSGISLPRVVFANEPNPTAQPAKVVAREIIQPLPVEFRDLCGLSLHVCAGSPSPAATPVLIELFAPDDDDVRAAWELPTETFTVGWLTLAFERAEIYSRRNLAIRIRSQTLDGALPVFSLGQAQLLMSKAAVFDGKRSSSSLAFKAWVSTPGVPLSLSHQMWPLVRLEKEPVTQIDLAIDGVEVVDVRRLYEGADFRPVAVDASRQRLLVHPLGRIPTIAELKRACPPGTLEIWAEVETDNQGAGIVEYAISVLPDEPLFQYTPDYIESLTTSVHWTSLPAKTSGILLLSLQAPLKDFRHLALMTRVPERAHSDACWANFKRVYFRGKFAQER